ncbi:MAG: hypothetical protein KC583_08705, partial [Myxococcales bacterium]|nr:hypothetical protein [Myxococcales bacterium]
MLDPIPRTAEEHFRLVLGSGVLLVIERAARIFGHLEAAFEAFPFLRTHWARFQALGLDFGDAPPTERWRRALLDWERSAPGHLPCRALREALALDPQRFELLAAVGLVEEDGRFGHLYAALTGLSGVHRPTLGLLTEWLPDARATQRALTEAGVLRIENPSAPRRPRERAQQGAAPVLVGPARDHSADAAIGEQGRQAGHARGDVRVEHQLARRRQRVGGDMAQASAGPGRRLA